MLFKSKYHISALTASIASSNILKKSTSFSISVKHTSHEASDKISEVN